MENSQTNYKLILTIALIFSGLGLLIILQMLTLGKLRLIFCDVGQGDGMLIVSPAGKQIVIDGGPGSKIVDCLSEKMPFWDRTVEMIVLTHPQKDHMEGLLAVLDRYQVEMIVTTGFVNQTELFKNWQEKVEKEASKIYTPKVGDRLNLDSKRGLSSSLVILWPNGRGQQIDQTVDLNETSVVSRLEYGQFCAYLTGDLPKEILSTLIDKECQVLKVSHHGSKTGTNEHVLDLVKPKFAVIQVGKNSYGHPHKEVSDLLESKGINILRNDIKGNVEIQTDGRKIKYKR